MSSNSSTIFVAAGTTDTERGTNLLAAYAAARLLTPGGNPLSASNRASVILPPGNYRVTDSFELDTNFVDLVAQVPQAGGPRRATDVDEHPEDGGTSRAFFRPPLTLVYSDWSTQKSTVIQSAADIRLCGFGIALLGNPSLWLVAMSMPTGAFMIGKAGLDLNNSPSTYDTMYFWSTANYYEEFGGCRAYWSFRGTWRNCISSSCSFRPGYGDLTNFPARIVFEADMSDCEAGPFSFLGDAYPHQNYLAENSRLLRCRTLGKHYEMNGPISGESGFASFAGCTAIGLPITSSVQFIDCSAGPNSFGVGTTAGGTFIRCRAGASSFGASATGTELGVFSGYAEDCFAGPDSFGGRTSLSDANNAAAKNSGTMVRCTSLGNTRPINLDGATIRDSRITMATKNQHGVALVLANTSTITNSEIIVVQGGNGIPVFSSKPRKCVIGHCRFNNAKNDANGISATVTNLLGAPSNICNDQIT